MNRKWCAIVLIACLATANPALGDATSVWQKATALADKKQWEEARMQLDILLQEQPDHEEALFLLARILSWQGRYDQSVATYKTLLHKYPDNADYLLGLAQVHFWRDLPHQAIPLLNQAVKIAPQYQAIWELLIRNFYAVNERELAEKTQREAAALFPHANWQQFSPPPVTERTASLPVQSTHSNFETGGSYENLDRNFASWNSTYIGGFRSFGQRSNIYGRASQVQRFDMQDVAIVAGLTRPLTERWTLGLEADYNPAHHFLPQWALQGSAHYKMDYGFGALFNFRHAGYSLLDTDTGSVGLERYWGDFRIAYTLYISQLQFAPEPTFSHLGQIAYFYGDRDQIGIAIGGGQQVMLLGPGRLINADVESYALHGQHWVTPKWALVYDISLNVQGTAYTRYGATFGVRYAF